MSTEILLIDLSSLAHQAWHTCNDDPNPDAASIKTIERVRSLASGKPHVAICLDTPPYFRKDIDPDYKANRAKDNNAVIAHQIALAVDVLKDECAVFAAKGYEADDVIATASKLAYDRLMEMARAEAAEAAKTPHDGATALSMPRLDVTIASADKDLLQLVSDRVTVLSTHSGNRLDPDGVKAKLGVWPHQVVDYLCLVGDTSDNIKGAKGIGAKRAVDVLGLFGNLDDAVKAATEGQHEKPDAIITSLQEFAPRLETVRSLIRLRTDAPIAFDDIFKERQVTNERRDVLDAEGHADDAPEAEAVSGSVEETRPAAVVPPAGPAPVQHNGPDPTHSGGARTGFSTMNDSLIGAMNDAQRVVNVEASRKADTFVLQKPKPDGPPESTALAVVEWDRQLEPRDMRQSYWIAQQLFKSRLFGAYGTPEAVLSTIMAGRDFGLSVMASLRAFHIIESKPVMSAGAIHALVLRSGKAKYFRCTERTAERATFVTQRGDDPPFTMSYTIEEAQQAWSRDQSAWNKSGWGKNPADMLVARCTSKLCRLVYPDVCFNLYSEEEF